MNNKYMVVANWKMNPTTLQEAEVLLGNVQKGIKGLRIRKDIEVIICPPYTFLPIANRPRPRSAKRGGQFSNNFKLGSQNCHWEKKGAYTGEISPLMLKDMGCEYVILGHSERRQYFKETDQLINQKIKLALKARLRPILCIGEQADERENILEVLESQLTNCLAGISQGQIERITIAYEPVWAIGTGSACGINETMQASILIRKILARLYSRSLSKRINVLYGGSVTSQNAADYVKKAGMDGLLVGGASLNASEFIKIVKSLI